MRNCSAWSYALEPFKHNLISFILQNRHRETMKLSYAVRLVTESKHIN